MAADGSCPLNFALSGSNGRGDRCIGPNDTWTCPKGCVSTGDPALDCRHIDPGTHRCAGACDAANVSPGNTAGNTAEVAQDSSATVLVPLSDLPLVVKGSRVVGRSETAYQLACVNWYGAHMEMLVNNGLNVKGLEEIASFIVQLKAFNCVRLPYSLDSLNMSNEDIPDRFSALCHNPELQAATPLEIFDATVKALTDAGLLVVLNNHVFRRGWCCSFDDGEGLWYNEDFEESVWLHHLGFMSRRYKDNPRVVGFDIRNEIRSTAQAVPSWGTGRAESDWALAAAKGSRRVLQEDPDMLVIVSGLEYSMYLCRVPAYPLHLQPEFQSHIIYTSHEYDWYLSAPQFLQMRAVNASMFFLQCFFATSAALLLLVPLALMLCKPQAFGSRVGCCRTPRWMRCTVMLQVLVAVVWVALFHSLLFLLGRVVADPCGKTDFAASIIFGLLWLPGFCLSLRLPWLLLLQLLPPAVAADAPSQATAPPTPSTAPDSCTAEARHAAVLGCDDAEMAELNESGCPERNSSCAEGDGIGMPVEVDELQPAVDAGEKSRRQVNRRKVFMLCLGMLFVSSINGSTLLYLESYEAWSQHLDDRWGFLLQESRDESRVAAVWLGEFGTASDNLWWNHMMRYMSERPLAGWAYWPLNGEKRPGEQEDFGILEDDMRTVRHPWKLQDLQRLAKP